MLSIINESDLNVDSGIFAVKFWATWCQPCKVMIPTMEKLEKEFPSVQFMSVDVDQVPVLAQNYKIKTVPTILLIDSGEEIGRIAGLSLIKPMRSMFREIAQVVKQKPKEITEKVAIAI